MKLTLAQVRKEIQKQYPLLDVRRGPGYYYFTSNDENLDYHLIDSNLQDYVTVMVNYCSHLSMSRWMECAHDVMAKAKEIGYEAL
jgi:hypothetical protein